MTLRAAQGNDRSRGARVITASQPVFPQITSDRRSALPKVALKFSLSFRLCVKWSAVKYFSDSIKYLGAHISYKNQYSENNGE